MSRTLLACVVCVATVAGQPRLAHAAPPAERAAVANPTAAKAAMDLARFHYSNRDYAQAARLFHQAYGLDPVPEYLFNAARAEQRGFELDDAERDFRTFLALEAISDESRKRAQVHLTEVQETRARLQTEKEARRGGAGTTEGGAPGGAAEGGDAEPTPPRAPPDGALPAGKANGAGTPAPPLDVRRPAPASAWQRPLAYGLCGAAALAIGYGGWTGLGARSDQGDLDAATARLGADGAIVGLTYADYRTRQTAIYDARDRAVAVGGIGLLLAAGGAWLWLRDNEGVQATLVPTGGGALLALRFGAAVEAAR